MFGKQDWKPEWVDSPFSIEVLTELNMDQEYGGITWEDLLEFSYFIYFSILFQYIK